MQLGPTIVPAHKLNGDELAVWNDIASSIPPGTWTKTDALMLTHLATISVMFRKAREKGDIAQVEKCGRLVLNYATKLRLTRQSRIDARAAGRAAENGADDDLDQPSWLGPRACPKN